VAVRLFRGLSLRQLLTLPYLVLVLGLAVVLGLLSYRTGRDAADQLSQRLLTETVDRITRAVDQQLGASRRVLDVAFPDGETAPQRISPLDPTLRLRFWLATSVHQELNNYAYYGDEQGRFFGLWRDGGDAAELRVRPVGEGVRTLYRFDGLNGALRDGLPETKLYDPRQRPWYQAARLGQGDTWSPIYVDFRTRGLVTTRARPVLDAQGRLAGVVATDVSLRQLSEFVQALQPSANGIAFVVEPGGNLIATSRGAHLKQAADGSAQRQDASAADDPLLASTFGQVRALIDERGDGAATGAACIDDPRGGAVQVAYGRLRDGAGLDWIVVVAVPRADFLQRVIENVYQGVALAVLAALAVVGVGWVSLGVVSRDLRAIASAARQMGDGHFDAPLRVDRHDEIGDLARSFTVMRHKLATDRLTGLANREATCRRIQDRIERHRRVQDGLPFALLFLDLDNFKDVNDRFGHEVGDQVLAEMARRMMDGVREADLVCRWAGDEFLVVLDGMGDVAATRRAAEKLQQRLAEPVAVAPGAHMGVSIGMAIYPIDGDDVSTLIRVADADMYGRKKV
jgi:diguanylate cyclase (GGDEF)-like protein